MAAPIMIIGEPAAGSGSDHLLAAGLGLLGLALLNGAILALVARLARARRLI